MAVIRRVASLAGKLNLLSAMRSDFVQTANGRGARRCLAAGMCVATGGAVALYLYHDMTSGRGRRGSRSINDLLPSIPTIEAKEKVGIVLNWRFTGNNKALATSNDLVSLF